MFFQEPKSLSVLAFRWYCHLVSVPLPATDDASTSLPMPTSELAVGVTGLPGLVRNAGAVASSVVQPVLAYALKV